MSVVAILATGLVLGAGGGVRLGLLALPVATAGLGVAMFHAFLEEKGTLECPAGIFGLGTAPQPYPAPPEICRPPFPSQT